MCRIGGAEGVPIKYRSKMWVGGLISACEATIRRINSCEG